MKYDIKTDGEEVITQPSINWDSSIGGGQLVMKTQARYRVEWEHGQMANHYIMK